MENDNQIVITPEAKASLTTAAKWAKFIAIMGFIGIGFMVLMAFFFLAFGSTMFRTMAPPFGRMLVVIYPVLFFVMAALYFAPILFLFRFAVRTQQAVVSDDPATMAEAFDWIKKYFRYIGILIIILLGIYALAIVGGIIAGIVAAVH